MKTLLVLRHAKSSRDDPALDDRDRPLAARGERDAPRMGRLVRDEQLSPDLVVCSDAVRARQTAEAMAEAAGYSGTILLEHRLYAAEAAVIFAVLRDVVEPDVDTVMIVGHNPGLEDLVSGLTDAREDLPTAALAQLALPIDRWSEIGPRTRGTLVRVWHPREL